MLRFHEGGGRQGARGRASLLEQLRGSGQQPLLARQLRRRGRGGRLERRQAAQQHGALPRLARGLRAGMLPEHLRRVPRRHRRDVRLGQSAQRRGHPL